MRFKQMVRFLLGGLLFLVLVGASGPFQTPPLPLGLQWSIPQRVPGYDDTSDAPYLVADQNRTVHAFNSVWMGKNLAIVYSQWTPAGGWTTPNDILLSPWAQQARIIGAFLDEAGMVHLAFFGGNDLQAGIFYSHAPLIYASRASAWSPLRLVGEYAGTPTSAILKGDGQGKLILVYSGNRDGVGLYSTVTEDGGETWTEPSVVSLVNDDAHWPTSMSGVLAPDGKLHIVWTLVNERGNGDVLFYSQLNPERREWSNPILLAERDESDYEVDWGSITFYQDQLIVVYDDSAPATRWMRRSLDGGLTWRDAVIPFNYLGEYGFTSYVVDSNGFLHMFLGNRTPSETHGMWHSVWKGERWSDLEPLISGPRVTSGGLAGRFDPTAPKAIVSQGNMILVTWSTDPGAGRNGVWFSYAQLDAPELPVQPLPTPAPEPTDTPPAALIAQTGPDPERAAQIRQAMENEAPPNLQSPSTALSIALLPVVILILAVIGYVYRMRLRLRS